MVATMLIVPVIVCVIIYNLKGVQVETDGAVKNQMQAVFANPLPPEEPINLHKRSEEAAETTEQSGISLRRLKLNEIYCSRLRIFDSKYVSSEYRRNTAQQQQPQQH